MNEPRGINHSAGSIEKRIDDIFKKTCDDYPFQDCHSMEKLYAIEEAIAGLTLANSDLHNTLTLLQIKHEGLPQEACKPGNEYFISDACGGYEIVTMTDRLTNTGDRVYKTKAGSSRIQHGYLQRFYPVDLVERSSVADKLNHELINSIRSLVGFARAQTSAQTDAIKKAKQLIESIGGLVQ